MVARVRIVASIFAVWAGFFLVARLGFFLAAAGDLRWSALPAAFVAGLRLDLSGAAYLTSVPLVAVALTSVGALERVGRLVLWMWLAVASVAGALLTVADIEIYRHWGRRIDAVVLSYLATPREAWASAGASPRWLMLGVVALVAVVMLLVFRAALRGLDTAPRRSVSTLAALAGVLLGLGVIGRGGLGTWPLTISSAYHTDDARANHVAENAMWGFFDSVYRRLYDRTNPFATMPAATADSARRAAVSGGSIRPSPFAVARPNVLLIIWESASARVVGSLGGLTGITPAFDSLAGSGISFQRFYASGDRTDKAVAALLSGFPGVPRGSITTTPSKSRALPSLQGELARLGYQTAFYYGGELEFAGLQGYLVNTGVHRRVSKREFPRSEWNSKWGAHDHVVADRILGDLDRMTAPFFAAWLTLSSHEPFEVPGEPTAADDDWQTRYLRSMRYADRVIGSLIARAKTRPWWSRTVVIIVGDHGRRVRPLDEGAVPRDPETEFRVPMLWLGGALGVRDSVALEPASQLDLTPTLLDLVTRPLDGVDTAAGAVGNHDHRWYGRSLARAAALPFGYYGFDDGFGLVTNTTTLVRDDRAGRDAIIRGPIGDLERRLGRALLQTSYQEYLDR